MSSVAYLTDEVAMDISRLTGLPWCWQKVHQRGVQRPYLDLTELEWWDRWRVLWAYVGAQTYVDAPSHPYWHGAEWVRE